MKITSTPDVWIPVFANDLDAFIPEIWANESLMILHENLVAAQMVYTDFSKEVAQAGDTVNTRRPAKFVSVRKDDDDSVTTQDATAANVAIKLDQHQHVSFIIKDGEESKGMGSLRQTYLEPAVIAIAQAIDEVVIGERYNFLDNHVGHLGTDVTRSSFTGLQAQMDMQLVPTAGRNLIVSPSVRSQAMNIDDFAHANELGDDGTAMREGSLGRKFGFTTVMSQNSRTVAATSVAAAAVNKAGGYASGATVIVVDAATATTGPVAGSWITIVGDDTPQLVVGTTVTSYAGTLTISPGLASAVPDNAVIVSYTPATINYGAGYGSAYSKSLVVDNTTIAAGSGQLVSTGTTATTLQRYATMSAPTTTGFYLNRPLDASLADNAVVGLGPAGDYSWAFHRNAVALISRPLALPAKGTGALSAIQDMNGIGIRVTITYDGSAQGHRVTVDLLCGVKTLDTNLGAILLS